jgi:hypothetical protein
MLVDSPLVGTAQTQWCKQGYYVEYNNTLRIGINDLNASDKKIIINLKDIENEVEKQIAIPGSNDSTKIVKVGESYELDYNNKYRYQITLNYIGTTGKNPFTKAAYITVATYKK